MEYEFTHVLLERGKAVSNYNLSDHDAAILARANRKMMMAASAKTDNPTTMEDYRLQRRHMRSIPPKIKTKPKI
jgi:hypothetical protein